MNQFGEFGVGSGFGESDQVRRIRHFVLSIKRRARAVGTVSSQCHRAVGRTTDNQTLSMNHLKHPLERKMRCLCGFKASWSINQMSRLVMSSIIIRFRLERIHCNVDFFFRCRLDVDYKSLQDVYCLRCCKKLKSKPGEEIKYSFYTLKWQQGYATSHLMKHVNQSHAGDMKSQGRRRLIRSLCRLHNQQDSQE